MTPLTDPNGSYGEMKSECSSRFWILEEQIYSN